MAIFPSSAIPSGAEDFTINQSLKFEASRSTFLNRTFVAPTNNKIWTLSCWVKKANNAVYTTLLRAWTDDSNFTQVILFQDGYDQFDFFQRVAGSQVTQLTSTAVYRDPSAWYHVVMSYDSTPGTPSTSSIAAYINGEKITTFDVEAYPAQNNETHINNNQAHVIMKHEETGGSGDVYLSNYLAEYHFIDGTAYDADDFGEAGDYGDWKPKEVSGLTYGTNGFYLDFADAADLGDDESC